ncbi:MAG: hypothetical protein DI539_15965 [Flavobacterium psychrophilum]|nr:MAG: hypothetical protein DI539_15965 [Flavobacterium psychrophilum]
MTPTKELLEGTWTNILGHLQQVSDIEKVINITFDTLPFDDYAVIKIVFIDGKEESVLYSGNFFLHQNARGEFKIAIRNAADDKEVIIQCRDFNGKIFTAEIGEYGTISFIKINS